MNSTKPLAEILRPLNFDDYIGQEHLIGDKGILRRSIDAGNTPSMILWGPPGVGKTTLAFILSQNLDVPFYSLSAINAGVKAVREVIDKASASGRKSVLFLDEIHRFSKSQQDSLLGAVETGTVTLIGATTENPSFEVISPLLSRSQVYILKSLEEKHLLQLVERAKTYYSEALSIDLVFTETAALFRVSGGDARKLYNAIELVVGTFGSQIKKIEFTDALVSELIQKNLATYDKKGEMHYDVISAFIKSIRGSDPNAAVYWLARMIEGGEDVKFIARRLLILASEDVGNANPNALLLANACFDAVSKIGWPESRIILSQTTVYLANSDKSNSTYAAINQAQSLVKKTGDLPVPLHLRNAPTKLMKQIGYGAHYKYAHEHKNNFVDLEFMPERVKGITLYQPGNNKREQADQQKIKERWKGKY
ncbi:MULTISPECIES: replication-associated recombination protein A [unclassified Lentimicrobium]|uniref:replication-associated recombination protein A n=1 Tax=unclassified Lentimicrobium TaxID=2677434 RepID=UPI0015554D88|nr:MULTISPECIES: replication-associated recombination protein A [unclassified Lentimicrobium]NPD45452.1 replication-associated recombination protein A [Lentimicrobium sp. S6]NPD86855.1 replication-associated recombination protein A [Lentimicrobium sp. L6]